MLGAVIPGLSPLGLILPLGSVGSEGVISLGAVGSGARLGTEGGSVEVSGLTDSRGSGTEGTAVGCSPPWQREFKGKFSQRIFMPSADIRISPGAAVSLSLEVWALEVWDSAGRVTKRPTPAAPRTKRFLSRLERSRVIMLELLDECDL
jgi:hypothetical protein